MDFVLIPEKLLLFIKNYPLPGWYIDVTGRYCCVIHEYLIAIFVNDQDNELDITVDEISTYGFDQNLEWETTADEKELAQTAMYFMRKYANW